MKKSQVSPFNSAVLFVSLAFTGFLSLARAESMRVVRRQEVLDFARNFSCSNPMLNWQFQNLLSVHDENSKAANKRAVNERKDFVFHDGTTEQWLYRGVTNRQFNESQILRVIFNDSTSVSESRWLTEQLFGNAAAQVVAARDQFQTLSQKEREEKFKRSILNIGNRIQSLVDQPGGALNGFTEHARVGSSFNGTPQAIQFLTPHKRFAEMYGEFVLHVREVVRRGIDVERYNYHLPSLGYRIGTIYSHDVDEYLVPSHIPSWDIQVIKVRDGSGWHLGNYGAPLYYYTKLYKDQNPCETYAVRVDILKSGAVGDSQRVPAGIILRCPKESCESRWDGSIPNEERLKQVVKNVKVDGRPLFFLPYKVYQASNPEVIKSSSLATLVDLYPVMSDEMKNNTKLWEQIYLNGLESDYGSALELNRLVASLRTSAIQGSARQILMKGVAARNFSLKNREVVGWLKLVNELGLLGSAEFKNTVLKLILSTSTRALIVTSLSSMSATNSQAAELSRLVYQKMSTMKNLTPIEEVTLAVKQKAGGRLQPSVFEAAAKGLDTEPGFALQVWKDLANEVDARDELFSGALEFVGNNPQRFVRVDGAMLWQQLSAEVMASPRDVKANMIGLILDLDFSLKKKSPLELGAQIGSMGLPQGREVDTIRSWWSYARSWTAPDFNAYQFYSSGIRNLGFDRIAYPIEKSDITEAHKEAALKPLREHFVQFFAESVSPPEPILGFSALYTITVLNKRPEIMLISDRDEVNIGTADRPIKLASQFPNGILKKCFSAFYLQVLRRQITAEKDDRKRDLLIHNLGLVIQGYKDYAYNELINDTQTADRAKLLQERFAWNKHDNTVGLAKFLVEMTSDSSKRSKLQDVVQALQRKFPQMPNEIPAEFVGDNASFWSQFRSRN